MEGNNLFTEKWFLPPATRSPYCGRIQTSVTSACTFRGPVTAWIFWVEATRSTLKGTGYSPDHLRPDDPISRLTTAIPPSTNKLATHTRKSGVLLETPHHHPRQGLACCVKQRPRWWWVNAAARGTTAHRPTRYDRAGN